MTRPPALALFALLVSVLTACAEQRGPVVLGMAGPLEESRGVASRRGAELAMREINAAGGINGDSLFIRFADDRAEGSRAAAIAQSFVDNDSILAVVGHVTSGAMLAAAGVYDGRLTALATAASSAALTGVSPWVFRVISSDAKNGEDLARFASRLGKKRVAILYENDAYGRGLADNFRRAFPDSVIGLDPIASDGAGAEIYVDWLAARRPDLVFVAGSERSGVRLLRAARQKQIAADFLGGDAWTAVANEPAAEGALVGVPFTSLDPRPEVQTFVNAFRTAYGVEPEAKAALAYDAVRVLADAIRAAGRDRARIREWLASRTGTNTFSGVTATFAFDSTGDPVGQAVMMTRISRGRLTVAERGAR